MLRLLVRALPAFVGGQTTVVSPLQQQTAIGQDLHSPLPDIDANGRPGSCAKMLPLESCPWNGKVLAPVDQRQARLAGIVK